MCWLDKTSIKQMFYIRDKYNINTFLETGTFKGVNVRFHSFHWGKVLSCDICDEYLNIAKEYNKDRKNIVIKKQSSPDFLKEFIKKYNDNKRDDIVFMFLDAHFYNPSFSVDKKWVVVNELKVLEGFKNCVICIHDFDCNGLGHCCYDGERLDFNLISKLINKVNPNFHFYINKKEFCDIYDEESIKNVKEIILDDNVLDSVRNTNSCDRLKYRGILYCVPTELDLNSFQLRRG